MITRTFGAAPWDTSVTLMPPDISSPYIFIRAAEEPYADGEFYPTDARNYELPVDTVSPVDSVDCHASEPVDAPFEPARINVGVRGRLYE